MKDTVAPKRNMLTMRPNCIRNFRFSQHKWSFSKEPFNTFFYARILHNSNTYRVTHSQILHSACLLFMCFISFSKIVCGSLSWQTLFFAHCVFDFFWRPCKHIMWMYIRTNVNVCIKHCMRVSCIYMPFDEEIKTIYAITFYTASSVHCAKTLKFQ